MTHTAASLTVETLMLLAFYRVVAFGYLRDYLYKAYSKQSWWDTLAEKEKDGATSEGVQREMVYWSLLTAHHVSGGLLMTFGFLFNAPELFMHGCLWELVDDLHDTIIMAFREWPFYKDKDNSGLMFYMVPHHAFGMITIFPIILNGYYTNEHVMASGAAMLMAGGMTLGVAVFNRMMDRKNAIDAWNEVFVGQLNIWVFFYCRFWIFPRRLYLFLFTDGFIHVMPVPVAVATVLGVSLITFFNVAVGYATMKKAVVRIGDASKEGSALDALKADVDALQELMSTTFNQANMEKLQEQLRTAYDQASMDKLQEQLSKAYDQASLDKLQEQLNAVYDDALTAKDDLAEYMQDTIQKATREVSKLVEPAKAH